MRSRLLLFEGPPGGGKSSISQYVAQQFVGGGAPVYWLEEQDLIGGPFEAFTRAVEATDGAAPQAAIEALLAGWHQITEHLAASGAVGCLDGALFHSSLKLMHAYDWPPEAIGAYLDKLYPLLAPWEPALVHLTGDVETILRGVIAERGAPWATHIAEDVAAYPCQRRLELGGVEGMIAFFAASQRQLEALADRLPFHALRLDTTARDWPAYQRAVCAWLGLPERPAPPPPAVDLAPYVGAYQPPAYFPPAFNHPFEVEQAPEGLRLHMVFMRNFRLIPQGGDAFAIAGRPLRIEFLRDAQGQVNGAIYPFVPTQRFVCEKVR